MDLFDVPDTFSLLQAALWLVRDRKPLPEEIFYSAPLELEPEEVSTEGALGQLVYALRAKRIQAIAGCVVLLERKGEFLSLTPFFHESGHFNIPESAWWFSHISWRQSAIDLLHDELTT